MSIHHFLKLFLITRVMTGRVRTVDTVCRLEAHTSVTVGPATPGRTVV